MYRFPYADITDPKYDCKRVNFHTHAGVCQPGKCGIHSMKAVADAYMYARYDALAFSNHDMYLPMEPDMDGILPLDAVEYSGTPHMLQVGVKEYRDLPHQEAMDFTREQGGFTILCHPNWGIPGYRDDAYLAKLEQWQGYTGIEIINPVIYRLVGSGLALDVWDHLLSQGRLLYGFGNDDFHLWHDMARAWNMIYASETSFAAIKEAVEAGRFYVSTGLTLKHCGLDGDTLSVTAGWYTENVSKQFCYKFTGFQGRLLAEFDAETAVFRIPEGEAYVRVEVTGENGAKLFLQPIVRV